MDNINNSYIWYASYGSNMNLERFLCYIEGGSLKGMKKIYLGCKNKNKPIKNKFFEITFPLYFSKYSHNWNGGVAFIYFNNNYQKQKNK
jgi:hypothetical protein